MEAKTIAKEVYYREAELKKCRRSILIHNINKWVEADKATAGYSLADRATAAVYKMTGGMVTVQEAFPLGQGNAGQPPTSLFMTFGSARQKSCFFRVLANKMRTMEAVDGHPSPLGGISCRDAFPKNLIQPAKDLVGKGMTLKREAKITSFRVVARGPGCIPVLEVRYRGQSGQSYGWETWKEDGGEDGGLQALRRSPVNNGPRHMMAVGLGAQPVVPMPGGPGRLSPSNQQRPHAQHIETVRLYNNEDENEDAEWREGEGQMDQEYFDN
jgi:hypothetical protein